MRHALVNGSILIDGHFHAGKALLIEGNRIAAILPEADVPADVARRDLGGDRLVPGFIDTQVNGGGGVLFNDAPTVEGIAAIGAAHRRFGTTGFMPTLISDDLAVIRQAVAAVDAAIEAGVPGVLGIHIEGPYLNIERKGIHDGDKIRPLDAEGLEVLSSLKRGRTLVTLAPERTSPDMVRQLVERGVIVAAGHSNGRYEDMIGAVEAGLSGVTHLYNAMSPLGSRKPGIVGAALEQDSVTCGIIVDGHHVSATALKIALRCKPEGTLMLVTDAMPSVGSDADEFMLQGRHILVRNGACTDDAGTLAGSNLDMITAVHNSVAMLDISIERAIGMASAAPAAFLGLAAETGRIAPSLRADLLQLDGQGAVIRSWIGGSY